MMSFEDKCELLDRIYELEQKGKINEARVLEAQLPVSAHIAMAMKEVYGSETVSKLTVNLSEAEEVYGKDWLSK